MAAAGQSGQAAQSQSTPRSPPAASSSSSSSHPSTAKTPGSKFAELVNSVVSGAFGSANTSGSAGNKVAESGGGANVRSGTTDLQPTEESRLHLPTSRWETAPWIIHESGSLSSSFPALEPAHLDVLWPGSEKDAVDTRHHVAKAVEELEMNWNLDPRLLGERSEGCKGSAAIVSLLRRLAIDALAQNGSSSAEMMKERNRQAGLQEGDTAGDGKGRASDEERSRDTMPSASSRPTRPPRIYERHDLLRAIERQDHETILEIRNQNFDLLLDSAPGTASGGSSSGATAGGGGGGAGAGGGISGAAASQTPLGYAISLGRKWEGTAIVLTGAMSKFVNSLPDPEEQEAIAASVGADGGDGSKRRPHRRPKNEFDPRTMARLRKLRGNLKLAVDHSLATDQTRLLASYIQVLFMSEGIGFILESVDTLKLSVRACIASTANGARSGGGGGDNDPVASSRSLVLQFVHAGLKTSGSTPSANRASSAARIAAVEDLIDNATGDLVLMALWDLVRPTARELRAHSSNDSSSSSTGGGSGSGAGDTATTAMVEVDEDLLNPLPAYFFARDDRVAGAFRARVDLLFRFLAVGSARGAGGCTFGTSSTGGAGVGQTGVERRRAREVQERLLGGGDGTSRSRLESGERLRVLEEVLLRRQQKKQKDGDHSVHHMIEA